jgi:serine/threonine protein kinase
MVNQGQCAGCGSSLSADLPEGLCPECLYRQALAGPGTGPYREEASRSPAPVFIPPTPAELAPHFPQLQIVRLLGQGGMGAVYLARQPELDRLLAVKILPPEVARDSDFTERFAREARLLARLNHPNIVTIFDFGAAGGLYPKKGTGPVMLEVPSPFSGYYFTMEYVDGKNVRELLEAGKLAPSQALRIIAQVCDALQYAHDEGFVHRDIKPENILLDSKGRVKIADFGLARLVGLTPTYLTLTGSQQAMGTLYYMAPEQMTRAHAVDHRADLYSLGVVFYEMLTGELPVGRFAAPSQRAGVDARLDAIVLRALAREPEHRHQDAAQIKREVESVLAGEPAPAAAASPQAPAAIRSILPCVRFTIPYVSVMGAWVRGEIYRDETALILEFSVISSLGTAKHKELRIPLGEILTISCNTANWPAWYHWLGVEGKTEIVLKLHHPEILAELPAGQHGRGRLKVHRGDRETAQQLVDSILRTPLPPPPARPARPVPMPAEPVANHDRVRRQLLGPAVGLLLTSAAALASNVVLAVLLARHFGQMGDVVLQRLTVAVCAVVVPTGFGLMLAGAERMTSGRGPYLLCVAAAFLALLPWSPAWLIGLPAGIWALVVLARPEVMAAFLPDRPGPTPSPDEASETTVPVAGKLRSWLRSVAGYFVSVSGTRAQRPSAEGRPQRDK